MKVPEAIAMHYVVRDRRTGVTISPGGYDSFEEAEEFRTNLPVPDDFGTLRVWVTG